MKTILLTFIFLIANISIAQTPCSGGSAAGFPCSNLDLQSQITPGQMDAFFANDSWGWTDPNDGTEYAIIGLDNGTAFIDISDPVNPIYLGKLPTHTSDSTWRDLKVYNDYVFIVSEAGGHGMQVFDLTRLRSVTSPPETFTEDAHYNGFGNAHNIAINEETGFAYAIGTDSFAGGPHFVNIQDPLNPAAAGGYSDDGYSHDAQVVTYSGPDSDHTGRELFIGSNTNEVVIVDVTDKSNPVKISSTAYSNVGYTHQGWLTEDHSYFLVGDEFDESNVGFNSRTIVLDFSDLDNPQPFFDYFGNTPSIDHNGYVKENTFYLANYTSGMRVIDISDIATQNMNEIAYFDTFPANDNTSFAGSWSVYPYFASENIVISGDAGMTLVRDSALAILEVDPVNFTMFPNPANSHITIASGSEPISLVEIYNVLGQQVLSFHFNETLTKQLDISNLKSGVYMVKINSNTSKRLIVR